MNDWVTSQHAPVHYYRYIDDIFCVFDVNKSDPNNFLTYLNAQHDNLRFTSEIGPSSLSFLDVMVDTSGARFDLNVFRKDTYTNLLLNFNAYCPYSWKLGLINCMLYRAYRICSSWTNFHSEVQKLQKIFASNGYPKIVFNRVLNKFLCKILSPRSSHNTRPDNQLFLVLPYFGQVSDRFQSRLSGFAKKFNLNVKLVFRPFKVCNYFSLKSRVPVCMQSGVVYQFTCSRDANITYIGKTKRHLFARIREHRNPQKSSAILDHRLICDCFCSNENFKILKSCSNDFRLNICEALLIKNKRPSLNQTICNDGRSIFLKLY